MNKFMLLNQYIVDIATIENDNVESHERIDVVENEYELVDIETIENISEQIHVLENEEEQKVDIESIENIDEKIHVVEPKVDTSVDPVNEEQHKANLRKRRKVTLQIPVMNATNTPVPKDFQKS